MRIRRSAFLALVLSSFLLLVMAGCSTSSGVRTPPSSAETWDDGGAEGADAEDADAADQGGADTAAEGGELGSEGFAEADIREIEEESRRDDMATRSAEELNEAGVLAPVYFGFDSSRLSGDALAKLEAHATWLRENPRFKVIVEGHCDERGTTEYNLALGARRAKEVRDYLERLGVDGERLETHSWGEEMPAVQGHGESAWAKNRRAEFRLEEAR